MEKIYFKDSELFGYSHTFNYWGDFKNYSDTQQYSIDGYITGSNYNDNISGVVSQISGILSLTSSGLSEIYVNNLFLGSGIVKTVEFEKSDDIYKRKYSASIEIPLLAGTGKFSQKGSINNTGEYFLVDKSYKENFIDFFKSETGRYIKNFSFKQDLEKLAKEKYTYKKSASFSIDPEIYDEYGVTQSGYAEKLFDAIARNYSENEFRSEGNYPDFYKSGSGISSISKSYGVYDGSFSYNESFTYQKDIPYTWQYNHSVSYNGDFATVDERGVIKSNSISGNSKFNPALTAWSGVKTGIQSRCSGVLTGYRWNYADEDVKNPSNTISAIRVANLSMFPMESSVSIDRNEGTVSYSQSFSTNQFTYSGYLYNYENSIEYGLDGYIDVTEAGSFQALNNINKTGMKIVLSAYSRERGNITGRVSGIYKSSIDSQYNKEQEDEAVYFDVNCYNKKEDYNEQNPKVSYSLNFSNNPKYKPSDIYFVIDSNFSHTKPTHSFSYLPVLNSKIFSESTKQSERGSFSNQISLKGKSNVSISDLLEESLKSVKKPAELSEFLLGEDVHASDYKYSYSPASKKFSLSLSYLYSRYRGDEDYLAY